MEIPEAGHQRSTLQQYNISLLLTSLMYEYASNLKIICILNHTYLCAHSTVTGLAKDEIYFNVK